MTLQGSGAISLSQIAGEFGGKNPLELGEYRGQDNAPTTGAISFSNFYGTDGIPTSGLQYHYDGQISEHNDPSAGNVQDLGSSNYTGTLTNGAAYNTGNFGKVVFDGVDDYVNLSGYNGVTGTTARTSIVFFKLDASPPSAVQRLLTWGDPTTNGQKWAMEITTARQIRLAIGGASRLATKQLTTTNWNMIAATCSGGSGASAPSPIFDFLIAGDTVVSGTGVPGGTTVTAFNSSAGTITLSNNLTTTLSNTTLTFTNTYLQASGGGGGQNRGSGGNGGTASGAARAAASQGSGGQGGTGSNRQSPFYSGGGGGAGGYTGNGGRGCDQDGSPSGAAGTGGGGGGGGRSDGGGGVEVSNGQGTSGSGGGTTNPGGGGSGGSAGSAGSGTGASGGNYGGGGGGAYGSDNNGGSGRPGRARFVWGSYSYPSNASSSASTQQTFAGSGTFTVPSGVTSVSAAIVGGGGGGGGSEESDETGGGGGCGALSYGSWTVSPGQQFTVTIGSGGSGAGAGNDGGSGGTSSITGTDTEAVSGTSGTNTLTAASGAANDIPNITLYHNAQKLTNYSDVAGAIDTSTGTNVAIGRANAGAAGNVDGEVAKALIYNRELTHAEVAQIYNAKCVALGLSQETASTETTSSPPTYSITQTATTIYETSGAGSPQSTTFTITTTNVANGTTLYWTCGGGNVSSADFTQNTTSGSFTINNNTGSVTLTARNDGVADDKETFTLEVRTGSTSGTVVATSSTITINE